MILRYYNSVLFEYNLIVDRLNFINSIKISLQSEFKNRNIICSNLSIQQLGHNSIFASLH